METAGVWGIVRLNRQGCFACHEDIGTRPVNLRKWAKTALEASKSSAQGLVGMSLLKATDDYVEEDDRNISGSPPATEPTSNSQNPAFTNESRKTILPTCKVKYSQSHASEHQAKPFFSRSFRTER